jgi:hypothetical protein
LLPSEYISFFPGYSSPSDNSLLISKRAADKRFILQKLSELEKRLNATAVLPKKSENYAGTEKIAEDTMDSLRDCDPNKFFKLAAEKGIIFSPDNFFNFVFGSRIKEATIKEIKSTLRDCFSTLEKDAEILNNERYDGNKPIFDPRHERSMIDKIAVSHSMYKPYVDRRLLENMQKFAEHTVTEKSSDKYINELAKQYVSYKLAALNIISDLGKLDDDDLTISVLQNRI